MTKDKITAVKRTIRQWESLRDNPGMTKAEYFSIHPKLPLPLMFHCYLCDIWHEEAYDCCGCATLTCDSECPLSSRRLMCNASDTSPFDLWGIAMELEDREGIIRNANRIVSACKRWLKKYDIKGKRK